MDGVAVLEGSMLDSSVTPKAMLDGMQDMQRKMDDMQGLLEQLSSGRGDQDTRCMCVVRAGQIRDLADAIAEGVGTGLND